AFEDMLREDRTNAALQALISTANSRTETEEALRHHQDVLLTDEAVQQIGELATKPDIPPKIYRVANALRDLLTIARTDGINIASITYLLPPFEQFVTRCFFALANDQQPDSGRRLGIEEILQAQRDKIDSDFPGKLREWSQTVLEKETQPDQLSILASAVYRLGKALRDFRGGNPAFNQAAAAACFQTSNQFSQRVIALNQAQARKEYIFDSVKSAVAAARRMKEEDGFDLFRGQRCAWPVVSSFRR